MLRVLGVLVARDLKVFYTHKFYTHAFFWIFVGFVFGIFGDFLEYFAQKVSSAMDSGMYFLSKATPNPPKKSACGERRSKGCVSQVAMSVCIPNDGPH